MNKKLKLKNIRKNKGITLIALVITIIILIILAGVSLNILLGNEGLIDRSKNAAETYSEKQAQEELELILADLKIDKVSNPEYNENDYINNKIADLGYSITGDIVIVNGWQFQIDKSVPKIIQALGKGNEIQQIEIATNVEYDANYEKAILKIEITYEKTIKQVTINGENIEIPEKVDGKYTITKEILKNGKYNICIKDENNYYKLLDTELNEILEDLIIKTVEDLVSFRENVNKGITYEGKTINLVSDLNLSGVCGESIGDWEPIGNYGTDTTHIFKGTFNGNNHIIDYLYINNTKEFQGLFGYADSATITGLVIGSNSSITAKQSIGAIVGKINNSEIINCGNNATITASDKYVGGIVGESNNSEIVGTYNKADITCDDQQVGGIAGKIEGSNSTKGIKYSYNTGDITAKQYVGGIIGSGYDYAKVYNCYNTGTIKTIASSNAKAYLGGISGRQRSYGLITYCYNIGEITNEGTGECTGGIVGINESYNGTSSVSSRASTISYCYNDAQVTSKGYMTGGIIGENEQYCYLKDSYASGLKTVKYNSTTASSVNGSSSTYLGRIIGYAYSTSSTYINNIGTRSTLPTIYNVVNGLSDETSIYWSNNDLNQPKLLWEK